MTAFCPHCDAQVEVDAAARPRCPRCHRAIERPDTPVPARSASPDDAPRRLAAPLAGAGLLLLAALAVGLVFFRGPAASPSPPASTSPPPSAEDLRARLGAAGVAPERASPPAEVDDVVRGVANGLTGGPEAIESHIEALLAKGLLEGRDVRKPRRQDPVPASALLSATGNGDKRVVTSLEAAFVAFALAKAKGLQTEIVRDAAPPQTPLLISRTRFATRVGATLINPMGLPMTQPERMDETDAVAHWLVLRADAARARNDLKAANADLAAAEALRPGTAVVAFAKCVVQIEAGMTEQGLAACEAALARQDDALARVYLANAYVRLGQPFKAFGAMEQASKLAPDLAEVALARAQLDSERLAATPEAERPALLQSIEAGLKKAQSLDPTLPGVPAGLARVALARKQPDQATRILDEALSRNLDLESALMRAQMYVDENLPAKAVELLERLDASDSRDEASRQALLMAYIQVGALDKADPLSKAALEERPEDDNVAMLRADLLRRTGRAPEAIALLEGVVKRRPDGTMAPLLLAQELLAAKRYADAEARLEPLALRKPDAIEVAVLLVMARKAQGKDAEAKAARDALAAKVPDGHRNLGAYFFDKGYLDVAAECFEDALDANAGDEETAVLGVVAYTLLDKPADASRFRARALEHAKDKAALERKIRQTVEEAARHLRRAAQEAPGAQGKPVAAPKPRPR